MIVNCVQEDSLEAVSTSSYQHDRLTSGVFVRDSLFLIVSQVPPSPGQLCLHLKYSSRESRAEPDQTRVPLSLCDSSLQWGHHHIAQILDKF